MGFGLVILFTGHLNIVTTSNCSMIANSHTLKFTSARINTSHSALSSQVVAWQRLPTP
jgi:hypothetical protein